MDPKQIYSYYSSDFVSEQLLRASRGREVAGALRSGNYDQRPNVLEYKSDIAAMARKGVTSFHLSAERWRNPMLLAAGRYDEIRTGWDFIIDLDSKLGMDAAKLAALRVAKLLESYGIRRYGIKFSGSRGFHICVPWESFPKEVDYKPLAMAYPEAMRTLARFVRFRISEQLMKDLLRVKTAKEMIDAIGEPPSEINPFYFVELEKDWGARHMFRAPFSLNEKTWLASVPLSAKQLDSFAVEDAKPPAVAEKKYPDFFAFEENQGEKLLLEAFDWRAGQRRDRPRKKKRTGRMEKRVPEAAFPPCIKNILGGLADGKKRSLFTIANFMRLMNWSFEEIEERMLRWNEANKPPLPRSIVLNAVRYHHQNPHTTANCFNDQFYVSFGVCTPDATCNRMNASRTSNPLAYPWRARRTPQSRGFSCMCGREFATSRALAMHKSRTHGE